MAAPSVPPSIADGLEQRRARNHHMVMGFSTDMPWNPYKASRVQTHTRAHPSPYLPSYLYRYHFYQLRCRLRSLSPSDSSPSHQLSCGFASMSLCTLLAFVFLSSFVFLSLSLPLSLSMLFLCLPPSHALPLTLPPLSPLPPSLPLSLSLSLPLSLSLSIQDSLARFLPSSLPLPLLSLPVSVALLVPFRSRFHHECALVLVPSFFGFTVLSILLFVSALARAFS